VAVAGGQVTKAMLRGPRFIRLFPDVYVSAAAEVDHRLLSSAAFELVAGGGGVLAGLSAATVLGADVAARNAPAEVLVAAHIRPHPRLKVRRGVAIGADRWTVRGVAVTSPLRTAWDLGRGPDLVDAVVAVDALAARGGFAPHDLLRRRDTSAPVRGCRRLDRVVALADPRAESPMESRLRLLLVTAGLPAPAVQHELVTERGLVARFDLAYPEVKLALEYDGRGHVDDIDRRRDIRTGRLGWFTARFTASDIARPTATADAVRALLAQRRLLAERDVRATSS
jgi:very-short-patch-repair endonuclease